MKIATGTDYQHHLWPNQQWGFLMYSDFSLSVIKSSLHADKIRASWKAWHCLSIENSSWQELHWITSCVPQSHSMSSIKSKVPTWLHVLHLIFPVVFNSNWASHEFNICDIISLDSTCKGNYRISRFERYCPKMQAKHYLWILTQIIAYQADLRRAIMRIQT